MIQANDKRVVSFYNDMQSKPRDENGHYAGSVQNGTGLLYVINSSNPSVHVWLPVELEEYSNAAAGSSGGRAGGIRITGFSTIKAAADFVVKITSSPEEIAKFLNSSAQDNIYGTYGMTRPVRKARTPKPEAVIITVDPLDRPISEFNLEELYGKGTVMMLRNKYPKTALTDYRILTRREYESRYALTVKEVI